jgi:hypothetical protein
MPVTMTGTVVERPFCTPRKRNRETSGADEVPAYRLDISEVSRAERTPTLESRAS